MMLRHGLLMTVVLFGSLVAQVGAEQPHQSDIDACNREAASAEATAAASPDQRAADAKTPPDGGEKTHDDGSASAPTMKQDRAAPSARERQAFAACLARHGYYKGYYH